MLDLFEYQLYAIDHYTFHYHYYHLANEQHEFHQYYFVIM